MTLNIFSCPNCAVVLDGHSFHFPDQKLWFHENGAINENYAGQNYGVVSGKRKCPVCKQDIYENEPDFVEHETPAQPETSRPEPPGYIEPVPVSERLPGAQDCDADGVCWWWSQDITAWCLCFAADGDLSEWTHWLPHWAIPLP